MHIITPTSLRRPLQVLLALSIITSLSGCTPSTPVADTSQPPSEAAATPVAVSTQTATSTPSMQQVWVDPGLPADLISQIQLPAGFVNASSASADTFVFAPLPTGGTVAEIYALAAQFYTVSDGLTSAQLKDIWAGNDSSKTILAQSSTILILTQLWGQAGQNVKPIEDLAEQTLEPNDSGTLLIVPLDQLQPVWKVLRVDGLYPLTHDLDLEKYPLAIHFGFTGAETVPAELQHLATNLKSNFDFDQLSIVAMTGTTALTRATAHQMDINGATWPAKDIGPYLRDADITHISNEVSFYEFCSKGNPNERSMMFCSRPEYMDLLKDVSTDVVELTGNHNLDYGKKPYTDSLHMYAAAGMKVYGGGLTEADARAPLLIEDHGNKFAFLGCNFVGPKYAMATENTMGAAHCDFDWFTKKITELRQQGYLPIFTFQYSEYLIHKPGEHQERDFKRMADAGAVVVSGSQAHFPQVMDIYGSSFLHYGPGNLFFDQMDRPVVGTREEFIDRHYFYNGRYLGTELVTALLEDFARPRPMTETERADFLTRIFADALPEVKPTATPNP